MFCWGNTIHGELSLGDIDEESIFVPREVNFEKAADVEQIAFGFTHTVLVTNDGELYSCGSNDFGQLGLEKETNKLQLIPGLDAFVFKKVACGGYHTLAVNEWGQLFSWGCNKDGQLGLNSESLTQPQPRLVKALGTRVIVQIACGKKHSLALTNDGELFAWGSNSEGQLGHGTDVEQETVPKPVEALAAVPIAFIACGSCHSIAISKSGAVYAWGNNSHGQLGLNDTASRNLPTLLRTLHNSKICYAACGGEFSVFLTLDGGVFTCGAGMYGQLGHGSSLNEVLPRQIVELMGSTVTQVSCGSKHTLALVPASGKVYAWGCGFLGQLGARAAQNMTTPQVVHGPWAAPDGSPVKKSIKESHPYPTVDSIVKRIFSGGDHCLAAVVPRKENVAPFDCRKLEQSNKILEISEEQLIPCQKIPVDSPVDQDLITYLETVFKSLACINGSFLLENDAHYDCSHYNHGVDLQRASRLFGIISELDNSRIQEVIFNGISENLLSPHFSLASEVESLRVYLTFPLYHGFANPTNCHALHKHFCKAVIDMKREPRAILLYWWMTAPSHYFERLVRIHKAVVLQFVKQPRPDKEVPWDLTLVNVLGMLRLLHMFNNARDESHRVPYTTFYLPELNDYINVKYDYFHYLRHKYAHYGTTSGFDPQSKQIYFSQYPFLFDATAKMVLLATDHAIQMHTASNEAIDRSTMRLFNPTMDPYERHQQQGFVVLNVTRENIIRDTLSELHRYDSRALKQPLKIKFLGEEAEDAGGVKKEFFLLLLKEILDPKYGMFKVYEETGTIWFTENTFGDEDESMYFLIGVICGLAIYNHIIVNIPFPLALYKKLLHEPVGLQDIKDLSPTIARSMQEILDYEEPDFEEVFCLNFEIAREIFSTTEITELIPGGSYIPVTLKNKKQFVDLYVDYILNKSVKPHFEQFYRGLYLLCGGEVLKLFHSNELMTVVVGNEDYDWEQLEMNTVYKEGYSRSDPTIELFWQVFRELSLEEKKSFLMFLTGSDRVPLQGMQAIEIVIQPVADERYLPVAHTCFNLLDLPRYQTREKLKYKLLQAIQQSQGFSLV